MRSRALVLFALVATAACATVAGVEITRPPGEGAPLDTDQTNKEIAEAAAEAAPDPLPDGASDAPVLACGCDAGTACCIPPGGGGSSCVVPDAGTCEGPDTFMLACFRPGPDGRDCCWNTGAPVRRTTYGPACVSERAACLADLDCQAYGGKCQTIPCKGVNIGICTSTGSAPGSVLNCPP